YGGHNSADVEYIRDELAKRAGEQRESGGNARLADALDAANEDFRIMVNQQQPEMAKELGLTRPGDSIPAPSSSADPDVNQTGPRGELVSYEQHVAPPARGDPEFEESLQEMLERYPAAKVKGWLSLLKDIGDTANDNAPLPDWSGRVKPQKPVNIPSLEEFELPNPQGDTMSPEEKEAWMKTAANDNAARDSDEYLGRYLPAVWSAPRTQLPVVWQPPRVQLPVVWQPPRVQLPAALPRPAQQSDTNAFSGWTTIAPTSAPRAPRQLDGFDFNALRPPQWLGTAMTAATNQPQYTQQPQN
ncbi:MAG: hypothetical protein JWO83_1171, partial [Caulobacteraceae bacterium]|nr:hypothetical protein [Caulobacteraceae bacterium]